MDYPNPTTKPACEHPHVRRGPHEVFCPDCRKATWQDSRDQGPCYHHAVMHYDGTPWPPTRISCRSCDTTWTVDDVPLWVLDAALRPFSPDVQARWDFKIN